MTPLRLKKHKGTRSLETPNSITPPPPTTLSKPEFSPLQVVARTELPDFDEESPLRKTIDSTRQDFFYTDSALSAHGDRPGLKMLEENGRIPRLEAGYKELVGKVRISAIDNTKLWHRVDTLESLSKEYLEIRNHFIEFYKRDTQRPYDEKVVKEGNLAAHGGDVLADVSFFAKSNRTDTWVLFELYGQPYDILTKLCNQPNKALVQAMNEFCTRKARANNPKMGPGITTELESAYIAFIEAQLAEPTSDVTDSTNLLSKYWEFHKACGRKA